jgi:hypothetical protein
MIEEEMKMKLYKPIQLMLAVKGRRLVFLGALYYKRDAEKEASVVPTEGFEPSSPR